VSHVMRSINVRYLLTYLLTRHQLLLIPRYPLSTFGHWAYAEKFEFLCSVVVEVV